MTSPLSNRARRPGRLASEGANQKPYGLNGNYTLPIISNTANGCTPDTWTVTTTSNAPANSNLPHRNLDRRGNDHLGRTTVRHLFRIPAGDTDPSTDFWTATSTTNAPAGREYHTAVWTGSEMIVWGGVSGFSYSNTGGRYNPGTDTWTSTSYHQRARWPIFSHGSLDRQRNDRLGRRSDVTGGRGGRKHRR